MRKVKCPGGTWTVLMNCIASGMPADWRVTFSGGEVKGLYRESRGFLPLGIAMGPPVEGPLEPTKRYYRGWFDASYRLEVCPETDLEAEIK